MRTLSPAVTMTNLPGIDAALFGAKRSAEPISIMLFRFLNLSPPCAASAARASSIGVVLAVIAGGAGIVLVEAAAAPLDFAELGSCAIAAELIRSRTSVGAYLFMWASFRELRSRLGSLSYTTRRCQGSEIKSHIQVDTPVAGVGAPTTAAAKASEAASDALRLPKLRG